MYQPRHLRLVSNRVGMIVSLPLSSTKFSLNDGIITYSLSLIGLILHLIINFLLMGAGACTPWRRKSASILSEGYP